MTTIEAMLEALAQLKAELTVRENDCAAAYKAALAPVQAQLDVIDATYATPLADLRQAIGEQEAAVKVAVISHGASVRGEHLHAVYSKGRETWDGRGLAGYAIAHPEINAFKAIGAPNVSIRAVQ